LDFLKINFESQISRQQSCPSQRSVIFLQERRAAAGATESNTNSTRLIERRKGGINSSIPGYSESPPRVGGNGKAKGRGIHPTQAPSAAPRKVGSVDNAVDALNKLHIRETATATGASKTRQSGEDSKKVIKGRGGGSFKYQPSSNSSAASATNYAEQKAPTSTSNFSSNSNNQGARLPLPWPPNKSLSINEDDDDSAPPGFSDPWED